MTFVAVSKKRFLRIIFECANSIRFFITHSFLLALLGVWIFALSATLSKQNFLKNCSVHFFKKREKKYFLQKNCLHMACLSMAMTSLLIIIWTTCFWEGFANLKYLSMFRNLDFWVLQSAPSAPFFEKSNKTWSSKNYVVSFCEDFAHLLMFSSTLKFAKSSAYIWSCDHVRTDFSTIETNPESAFWILFHN